MLLDLKAINLECEPMEEEKRGFSIEWEETRERHSDKNIPMECGKMERRNLLELTIETRLSLIGEERRARVGKITKVRRYYSDSTYISQLTMKTKEDRKIWIGRGYRKDRLPSTTGVFPLHVP